MVECVLSQLKPSELYIHTFLHAAAFFNAQNVEYLGLYPIHTTDLLQRNNNNIWSKIKVNT